MKQRLSPLWTGLLDKFRVSLLLGFFILIWGTISYQNIPRESTPQIDIPSATITTVWPGASPGDVEKLVTNKIEKEIKTLENLEEYTSQSLSGVSVVVVEFTTDSDKDLNMQKLREKVDNAERDLPQTLPSEPNVREESVSDRPIVSMTLSGDFSWSELKNFAEVLEDEFESISKVKEVQIKGAPVDEMHIVVDPIRIEQKQISVAEIISAVRAAHRDMPLGVVNVSGEKIEVTAKAEMQTAAEFSQVPIKSVNGAVIRLEEIAEVRREFRKFDVETYFNSQRDSQPAILIDVIKSASKGNVLLMVDEVFERLEKLRENGKIPDTLNTTVTYNRADEIGRSLETLTDSGGQTLALIAIVMLIFVGWRESLLAAIAIPLSMLIAIIVLESLGRTFNGVSLFALVLAVGLLVDNAIVIVEGMSEGINDHRLSPRDAALRTIETFRWPLITGTMTTVFAFFPLLIFITGISGQYVSVIPITVTTVLLGALFVSLWLLPTYSAKFFAAIPPAKHKEGKTLKQVKAWYEDTMYFILKSKPRVHLTLLITAVVFIFSLSLIFRGKIPVEVFPSGDQTYFTADFELPEGTNLEKTRTLIPLITDSLKPFFVDKNQTIQTNKEAWIESLVFTAGSSQNRQGRKQDKESLLGLTVNLVEEEDRDQKSYDIIEVLRQAVESVLPAYVESEFNEVRGGPPSGAPIEVRFIGEDLARLEKSANFFKTELAKLDGVVDVKDSRKDRVKQVTWRFDRDLLAVFGLTPNQVMETLRTAVNGVTVVRLTEGDEEIDTEMRLDWRGDKSWKDPESLDILARIPIKTPTGNFINLEQVAEPELSSELAQIDHRDGKRIITVSASLNRGATASQLVPAMQTIIAGMEVIPGEIIEIGGDSEEGNRLISQSVTAMLFALILIFIVLVAQFDSFFQPLVILSLIPLSLTGVFIGFWLTNMNITFPTMIGIVSLAGIIVNDAIVLIDQINRNLGKGMEYLNACVKAGQDRFQPIFLTSITTVVGMLPLALSDEFWGGLGFAIIFGMALSTILCLLLTPCFLLEGRDLWKLTLWAQRKVRGFFWT